MGENHSEGGYPVNFGSLSALTFHLRFPWGLYRRVRKRDLHCPAAPPLVASHKVSFLRTSVTFSRLSHSFAPFVIQAPPAITPHPRRHPPNPYSLLHTPYSILPPSYPKSFPISQNISQTCLLDNFPRRQYNGHYKEGFGEILPKAAREDSWTSDQPTKPGSTTRPNAPPPGPPPGGGRRAQRGLWEYLFHRKKRFKHRKQYRRPSQLIRERTFCQSLAMRKLSSIYPTMGVNLDQGMASVRVSAGTHGRAETSNIPSMARGRSASSSW